MEVGLTPISPISLGVIGTPLSFRVLHKRESGNGDSHSRSLPSRFFCSRQSCCLPKSMSAQRIFTGSVLRRKQEKATTALTPHLIPNCSHTYRTLFRPRLLDGGSETVSRIFEAQVERKTIMYSRYLQPEPKIREPSSLATCIALLRSIRPSASDPVFVAPVRSSFPQLRCSLDQPTFSSLEKLSSLGCRKRFANGIEGFRRGAWEYM